MPYEFYKIMHYLGLCLLLSAIIGLVVEKKHNTSLGRPLNKKLWFSLHGIGLLLLFVAGFGLMARLGLASDMPKWIFAKLGIWLAFGGLLPMLSKGSGGLPKAMAISLVLIGSAAWLAITKPF